LNQSLIVLLRIMSTDSQYNWDELLQEAESIQCQDHFMPDLLKDRSFSALEFQKQLTHLLSNNTPSTTTKVPALLDLALTSSILSYRELDELRQEPKPHPTNPDSKPKRPHITTSVICGMLTCWSHHLSCDELPTLLNYLFSRTTLICRLSHRPGTELQFLKFANHVLSRVDDIELAGHWMVFMANFVQIDSRSGQNHLGNFNLSNITILDQPEDAADSPMVDQRLYSATWQLQDVFRDPQKLGEPKNAHRLQTFQENLDFVLDTFRRNPIPQSVAAGHFATRHTGSHHCKYLTSQRLFTKQLHNPSFRRSIMVQTLILLKSHSVKVDCQKPKLSPMAKFDAEQQQWFSTKYADILNHVLPAIPPDGARFAKFVKGVLDRDENWIHWKFHKGEHKERCGPFVRAPIKPVTALTVVESGCSSARVQPPAMKRRKLNHRRAAAVPLKEEAFRRRHLQKNRWAISMGNTQLKRVFDWMPDCYRSRRNVERHWRDEMKGGDKGLGWLKEHALIDFEQRLEQRLSLMVEEALEQVKLMIPMLPALSVWHRATLQLRCAVVNMEGAFL